MAKYEKWVSATPDDAITAVATASLQIRLQAVQDYLQLAAGGSLEEVEHLHQLRVWTRRSVAALDVFAGLLPRRRAAWLRRKLKQLREDTNQARDDDVFLRSLAQDGSGAGVPGLLERVARQRQHAQRPLLKMHAKLMRGGRLERRVGKLLKRVRAGRDGGPPADCSLRQWAPGSLQAEVEAFNAAAQQELSDLEALHKFRIAGKRLRYTLELIGPAFPDTLRTGIYPLIQDLQERLGNINDHVAAEQRLEHWLTLSEDAEACEYLQARIQAERQQRAAAHDEFLVWWNGSRSSQIAQAFADLLKVPGPPAESPPESARQDPGTAEPQVAPAPESTSASQGTSAAEAALGP
jgi:CHAD domain-containing protein